MGGIDEIDEIEGMAGYGWVSSSSSAKEGVSMATLTIYHINMAANRRNAKSHTAMSLYHPAEVHTRRDVTEDA